MRPKIRTKGRRHGRATFPGVAWEGWVALVRVNNRIVGLFGLELADGKTTLGNLLARVPS